MSKRYHIFAAGGGDLPDIDEDMDEIPDGLIYKYEVVDISMSFTISGADLKRALAEERAREGGVET